MVHTDNPADTFTVDIFGETGDFLVMRNINNGCIDTAMLRIVSVVDKALGASSMEFDGAGGYDRKSGCLNPKGSLYPKEDRSSIVIDYVFDKARINKMFVGSRRILWYHT